MIGNSNTMEPADLRNTYSNCKAAIFDGNPVTIQVISLLQLDGHYAMRTFEDQGTHGRSFSREVLTAPPFERPLC